MDKQKRTVRSTGSKQRRIELMYAGQHNVSLRVLWTKAVTEGKGQLQTSGLATHAQLAAKRPSARNQCCKREFANGQPVSLQSTAGPQCTPAHTHAKAGQRCTSAQKTDKIQGHAAHHEQMQQLAARHAMHAAACTAHQQRGGAHLHTCKCVRARELLCAVVRTHARVTDRCVGTKHVMLRTTARARAHLACSMAPT